MTRLLFAALVAAGCGGGFGGVSPALTAPSNPTPYTDSIFTTCTVFVTDGGNPGMTLPQADFTPSSTTSNGCPQSLVSARYSNSGAAATKDRYFYYLSSFAAPDRCWYVNPSFASDNSIGCKLSAPPAATMP